MKPPPFAYAAPATIEEALELLRADGARVLAGGQSLVPRMSARLERPSALVDVNRVAGLDELDCNGDVVAGATVRADTLARAEPVAARLAVLADAAARVGHPAVRNRGTVGGNLAFADPANNLPVVAVALDAVLTVRSASGSREVAASDFFRGAWETALEPGELLCSVRFPGLPDGAGSAYYEVAARSRGWGLAGAAAAVWDGGMRVALGGVGETPVRIEADSVEAFVEAARTAVASPRADLHASSEHRRHLAGVVVERALRAAISRAERSA
jgi:carbon-monoxide dehydrogenase medium subunit